MTKERIPKSLKECYSEDKLSSNLKYWSEKLKIWGKGIFIFLLVIGFISTVVDGIGAAEMEYFSGGAVWTVVIGSIIQWTIYAILDYFAYQALSLLIAALASIVENTRIAADVAIYREAKEEGLLNKTTSPVGTQPARIPSGGWRCKKCGRVMPQYTGTCACGNTKYEN